MNAGALILAAGSSSRLGRPKQLHLFKGETLLDRSARVARGAGCQPVVVVLGAYEELIRERCELQNVEIVSNPAWSQGMGTSLACGVPQLGDAHGIVVMTCDMPAVTAEHLRKLTSSGRLTASGYAGRKGVPAYFPSEFFAALMDCRGDVGAKELLRSADVVGLEDGERDIDTLEDVADLQNFSG